MSYYGRLAIEVMDRRWPDAEFWAPYLERLHRDERKAVVAGEIGVIKRPFSPEWPVGEWMELASNFWIKPAKPRFTHRGWRISFDVRDFRARMPRHVPGMYEPPQLDHFGMPIPHDAEAIEAARLDGNYTAAHALAVPDVGDGVPDEYDNVIKVQSREKWVTHLRERQADKEMREDLRRVNGELRELAKRAVKAGVDPVQILAPVVREIESQHRELSKAA